MKKEPRTKIKTSQIHQLPLQWICMIRGLHIEEESEHRPTLVCMSQIPF